MTLRENFKPLRRLKVTKRFSSFQSGLIQGVAEGSMVVSNMWTEDFTKDQYKVYFDSADFNSGKPLIQGAYILVKK